jgi:phosphopantetheinyl transferase
MDQLFTAAPWLNDQETEINAIHLEKRRLEWSCTQILKKELKIEEPILFYQSGKPYLASDRYISISHGDQLASVITGTVPMGIDVQLPNSKIEIIRKRFCSSEELTEAEKSENPLAYLTTIWSAKEAIFKIFGEQVHFAEDIRIFPFATEDSALKAVIRRSGVELFPKLHREILHGHHMVIAWLSND